MAFCSQVDIEDILSSEGVLHATSDLGTSATADKTMVANAIERATVRIKQFIGRKYDASELSRTNAWIKWAAATIAAVMLMRRRGGGVPPGLQESYDEISEYLKEISKGIQEIPDAVPVREPGVTMTNLAVDMRYYTAKIRERVVISAGERQSAKPRRPDIRDQFFNT